MKYEIETKNYHQLRKEKKKLSLIIKEELRTTIIRKSNKRIQILNYHFQSSTSTQKNKI